MVTKRNSGRRKQSRTTKELFFRVETWQHADSGCLLRQPHGAVRMGAGEPMEGMSNTGGRADYVTRALGLFGTLLQREAIVGDGRRLSYADVSRSILTVAGRL